MREAHKYAQTFSKRLKTLIYLMLTIGVLLLLIGITKERRNTLWTCLQAFIKTLAKKLSDGR